MGRGTAALSLSTYPGSIGPATKKPGGFVRDADARRRRGLPRTSYFLLVRKENRLASCLLGFLGYCTGPLGL